MWKDIPNCGCGLSMLHIGQSPQECDATGDAMKTKAGLKKVYSDNLNVPVWNVFDHSTIHTDSLQVKRRKLLKCKANLGLTYLPGKSF